MKRTLGAALVIFVAVFFSSETARPQATAGGFGNFGLGTNSGFGSIGGTSGANAGTAGLSSLGGFGTTGATGATGGQTGAASATGLGTTMAGGGTFGSFDASFGATQLASGLATAAAMSRATSSLGGSRSGFGGGFGSGFGGGGFGGGRGGFGGQTNNQQETKIRAVVRLGFPVEARSSTAMTQMVSDRFSKMPLPKNLDGVQISMDGRTAILRGQIEATEDGKLIERLLSLEPGIDGVRNELTVAGQANSREVIPSPIPVR